MTVVVSRNVALPQGIANGSRAKVVRLQLFAFKDGEAPATIEVDPHAPCTRVLRAEQVAGILLRLLGPNGEPSNAKLTDSYGPGEFMVLSYPMDITVKELAIQATMTQFPLLPAFAVTGHKTQGLTMTQMILAETQSPTARFLYVVLSRLKKLSGLQLLQPLPMSPRDRAYSRGEELEKELARLHALELDTARNNGDFFARALGHPLVAPAPSVASLQGRASATTNPQLPSAPRMRRGLIVVPPSVSSDVAPSAAAHATPASARAPPQPRLIGHSGTQGSARWQARAPLDALCVPGLGDCGLISIVMSMLCPLVQDVAAFDAMLRRLLNFDTTWRQLLPVQLPAAVQAALDATAAELKAVAANNATDVRGYLIHYLAVGRYDNGWLAAVAQDGDPRNKPAIFSAASKFINDLVDYVRALTFHYVEYDDAGDHVECLVNIIASEQSASEYLEKMRTPRTWLGQADFTCIASVLHLRIAMEDYLINEPVAVLEPQQRWSTGRSDAGALVHVRIRYVNLNFDESQVRNHYVGVLTPMNRALPSARSAAAAAHASAAAASTQPVQSSRTCDELGPATAAASIPKGRKRALKVPVLLDSALVDRNVAAVEVDTAQSQSSLSLNARPQRTRVPTAKFKDAAPDADILAAIGNAATPSDVASGPAAKRARHSAAANSH
jgi:hypothetical protein